MAVAKLVHEVAAQLGGCGRRTWQAPLGCPPSARLRAGFDTTFGLPFDTLRAGFEKGGALILHCHSEARSAEESERRFFASLRMTRIVLPLLGLFRFSSLAVNATRGHYYSGCVQRRRQWKRRRRVQHRSGTLSTG